MLMKITGTGMALQPGEQGGAVLADFRHRPDDAVHLAREQVGEDVLAGVVFGLAQQAEEQRIAQFVGLAFDAGEDARGAVIAQAIADHADGVAAALDQAAGEDVGRVAQSRR